MHKTLGEGKRYCEWLAAYAKEIHSQIDLFVIPPYTAIYPLKETLKDKPVRIGSQNMHWMDEGPYTGEISPLMLTEAGIDLVELGHSERRQYYNENDADLSKKVKAALDHHLTPLLCIGESLIEKQLSAGPETVERQLKMALAKVEKAQAGEVQIAYEPVWAIGNEGTPASPEYVEQMHRHIRQVLIRLFGKDTANIIPVIFGGSVNTENYLSYLKLKGVDGLFIGRAAWDIETFREILAGITCWLNKKQ